jgi:hypothetical protein
MLPASSLVIAPLTFVASCVEQPQLSVYESTVRVESDPGQPLAGAELFHSGSKVGTSGPDGRVAIRATGNEGERIDLRVQCPEGHRSPNELIGIALRKAADPRQKPEYSARCSPLKRKLVVAVRLENGGGLPIRHLGSELSRTDSSGVAHLLLEGEPNETLELTLDTTEQPRLRPKSPSAVFRVGDRDELVVLNQTFESKTVVRRGPARPAGPVRIR